jgi:pilus assembly protein CpaC
LNRVSDLIREYAVATRSTESLNDTFSWGVVHNGTSFVSVLRMLQEKRVAKILAEPNLLAVSGRPAQFNVGGEFPVLIPQSLGTASIEYKPYGTQVDFLPIVLGNGNIRLEVRPRISEIDPARSVTLDSFDIPALTVRQVDTAVEMKAGQTFAIGGLVQERTESVNRGLPYISDLPVLGVPFRNTSNEINEIELLILVTPEFVDPIDPHELPCGGPGYATTNPSNHDLWCGGHVEVPTHCNPISGMTVCGEQYTGYGCSHCNNLGCSACGNNGQRGGMHPGITDGVVMPGGTGYDDAYGPTISPSTPVDPNQAPVDMTLPESAIPPQDGLPAPGDGASTAGVVPRGVAASSPQMGNAGQSTGLVGVPQYTAPRPYSPTRQPVFVRNATKSNNRPQTDNGGSTEPGQSGLIGPVGYDPQ